MTRIEEAAAVADRGGAGSDRTDSGTAADAVTAQLRAFEAMSGPNLRVAWRRLYRAEPPKRMNRELLTLAVAWKIDRPRSVLRLTQQQHTAIAGDVARQRRRRQLPAGGPLAIRTVGMYFAAWWIDASLSLRSSCLADRISDANSAAVQ